MSPGLQEWIHKLEEGAWAKYLKFVLLALALLGFTALWHIREAKNFAAIEAMDGAQVARNISEGKGFSTQFVRPLSIAMMEKVRGGTVPVLNEPHPDIANPPVYPLLLAGLMKVLPFDWTIPEGSFWRFQPEVIIGIFNQALFFLAMFLLFRITRNLFDSAVAWLATVAFAGTELFWDFTTSGLSTMLLIVFFLLLVLCLVSIEKNAREGLRSPGWFLGMGITVGGILALAALTRYSLGWLILPTLGFLALVGGAHRVKLCLAAAVVLVLALAPWVVRNYSVSALPFGTPGLHIYAGTSDLPDFKLERSMPKDLSPVLNRVAFEEYPRKLVVNSSAIVTRELPLLGGNWLIAFFLVALLVPFRNPALSRIRFFIIGSLLTFVVVQALGKTDLSNHSPTLNSENLLVILAPLLFAFGAGLFFILIDQIEFPMPALRQAAVIGFVLLLTLPLILRILPPRSYPTNYPPYSPSLIQEVSHWLRPDELMMSDMPWAVAWYGGRQAVWATLDAGNTQPSDFFHINDYQKAIKGLYLTQITIDEKFVSEMLKAREDAWGRFVLDSVLRTNVPRGFPLKKAPPGLFPHQLFLTDQTRWK